MSKALALEATLLTGCVLFGLAGQTSPFRNVMRCLLGAAPHAAGIHKRMTADPVTEHPLIPRIPLARLLGFEVTSAAPGEAVVEMEPTAQHFNPMGTLHGGVICSIADTAMGVAHASLLAEGEATTTLELKINFLKPIWTEKLRAFGKVIRPGKTISLVECEVFDPKDRLVAKASSTCMTLRGEQASGRMVER